MISTTRAVLEADFLPVPGRRGYTLLQLDGEMPSTRWKYIEAGGQRYRCYTVHGVPFDVVAIEGDHDLTGFVVRFVEGSRWP